MGSIRRRLWQRKWWIALLLFASVFGGYLYSRWPIRGTTADGTTTIELLHVGAGNFDYESDDIVLKTLRKWTPKRLQKYLPRRISLSRRPPLNDAGALKLQMLFSYEERLGPKPYPKAGLRAEVQFLDSAGRIHIGHWDRRSQNMSGFLYLGFDAWPRRERTLRCRIVNRNDGKTVLEFQTRNPCYRPDAPVWTPNPMPVVAEDDDVRVTLKGIRFDPISRMLVPEASVESKQESRPWRNVNSFSLEDASGNTGDGVLLTEPAWRVHLRMNSTRSALETRQFDFVVAPPEELRQAVEATISR